MCISDEQIFFKINIETKQLFFLKKGTLSFYKIRLIVKIKGVQHLKIKEVFFFSPMGEEYS